jgi:Txe/YoeB family toxin of Txe-Axe toxin-antitoxin module
MRKVIFESHVFQDFVEWGAIDRKPYQRIVNLIFGTLRHLFSGLAKAEACRPLAW